MNFLSTPRRILITGASQGIGRATALALAGQGHSLVLAARNADALHAVAEQIHSNGGHAQTVVLDVTDSDSVKRGVCEVLAEGPLDVLVNNAGNCLQREFLWCSEADLQQEMDLNYFGAQRMIRALLPAFVGQRAGRIINVSSLLGSCAAPTTANYAASKAALEAFSCALRGELARFSIHVTVFVAPHTRTELGTRTEFRGVTSLPVEYVAREMVHAIDTSPRRYAASPVYRLLLRLAAWFPALMERKMVECVQHLFREPGLAAPQCLKRYRTQVTCFTNTSPNWLGTVSFSCCQNLNSNSLMTRTR